MSGKRFPYFSDGDVEIHFYDDGKAFYLLHSAVLSAHSQWFKASLSEEWNEGRQPSMVGGRARWIYELRFDEDSDFAMFVRRDSPEAATKDLCDSDDRERHDVFIGTRYPKVWAHHSLLAVIYHERTHFDHWSFASSRSEIAELLELSGAYMAENPIKRHIGTYLERYDICAKILEKCHAYPISMLEFAVESKTAWIFEEAAINLVGRSDDFFLSAQEHLKELDLYLPVSYKRDEFKKMLQKVDYKLAIMQPDTVSEGTNAAIAFFRHWLAYQINQGRGSGLCQGYAALYHALAKEDSQLTTRESREEELETWMRTVRSGASEPSWEVIKAELRKIWTQAAKIVEPLLEQRTKRQNTKVADYRALTCIEILSWDLPPVFTAE